jgi:LysM repeat protein
MKRIWSVTLVCVLLILLGAPAAWAGPPRSNPIVHVVQWGENLIGIARRYGTTTHAIMAANRLANPNRIYAGQRLVIPGQAAPGGSAHAPISGCTYVVRPGDTLSGIAYRHGLSVNGIVRVNGITNPHRIYSGQRLIVPCAPGTMPAPAPAPRGTYYVVRPGDTLAKIAMRFRTNMWAIVRANNIANPHLIYVGQRFYIPKAAPVTNVGRAKPGCEHLAWPRNGVWLSGVVRAWGTADHEHFGYYKLEYRHDGLGDWFYITGDKKPVHDGPLGEWDTRAVDNGPYTFRLVVVDQWGNYPPPCELSVRVRN